MASNVQHGALMRNAFSTFGFGLAALFSATVVVVACSSDPDPSEFPGDPAKNDAGEDSPGSFSEGGTTDAKEGGPTSCTPSTPNPFTPTWKVPVKAAAACSTQDLKEYYTACLFNASVTEPDGTCAAYKTAHPACVACTEPDDHGGPIQWHAGRKFYTLNVAGCIALNQEGTDAGAAGCGEAYNAAVDCARQSCLTCVTEANSFLLFSNCQTDVKQTTCQTYETGRSTACGTGGAAYAGALDCFPKGAETTELQGTGISETFYTRVMAFTCGP
jgi:hypothetical protein